MASKGEMEMVTIRLYAGDKETLQAHFPKEGYNAVIRKLVNRVCSQLRERTNQNLPPQELIDDETIE